MLQSQNPDNATSDFKPRAAWPGFAALVFVVVLAIGLFSHTLQYEAMFSGDTFLHIRLGDEILNAMSLPHSDTLSFTAFGKPYIAHEWAFEIILTACCRALGVGGIVLIAAILLATMAAVTTRRMQTRGLGVPAIVATLAFVWTAIRFAYRSRPHLFTMAAFPIGMAWLDTGAWKRRSWTVPAGCFAAILAWTSVHPVSMLFVAVLWIELAAAVFRDRAQARWALVVGMAAALGAISTPYGLRVPLNVVHFMSQKALTEHITEHMPLVLSIRFGALAAASMVVVAAYWLASSSIPRLTKPRLGELLALAFLSLCTIHSRRWGTLLALAAAPILGLALEAAVSPLAAALGFRISAREKRPPALRRADFAIIGLALALAVAIFRIEANRIAVPAYLEHDEHPVVAAEYVRAHPELFGDRMYNSYEFGSFLTFALSDRKVFVDGRAELYESELVLESVRIRDGDKDALKLLDKWKIDWAIFRRGLNLEPVLNEAGWQQAYRDKVAVIFRRVKTPRARP